MFFFLSTFSIKAYIKRGEGRFVPPFPNTGYVTGCSGKKYIAHTEFVMKRWYEMSFSPLKDVLSNSLQDGVIDWTKIRFVD